MPETDSSQKVNISSWQTTRNRYCRKYMSDSIKGDIFSKFIGIQLYKLHSI